MQSSTVHGEVPVPPWLKSALQPRPPAPASLLTGDRAVLTDADRWLVELFTARGHDPALAPRLWLAVHDTVGDLSPLARADLAALATRR